LEVWLFYKRDHLSLRTNSYGDSMAASIQKALAAFAAQSNEWKRGIQGTSKFVGLSKSEQRTLALMLSGVPPWI
jgi:hypothetical protein